MLECVCCVHGEGLGYSRVPSVCTSVLFEYSFGYNYLKQKKKRQILSHAESDKPEQMHSHCTNTPSAGERRPEMAHIGKDVIDCPKHRVGLYRKKIVRSRGKGQRREKGKGKQNRRAGKWSKDKLEKQSSCNKGQQNLSVRDSLA